MVVLLLLQLLNCASQDLKFVIEVCRHGARSPITFFQWDVDNPWPQGPGELTPGGMRQHFLLGQELRQRYINERRFLSANFTTDEFFVFSTDVNRTIMSALSQLAGLYPQGTGEVLRLPSLNTTAVPPTSVYNVTGLMKELGNDAVLNQAQIIPIHSNLNSLQYALAPSGTNCTMIGHLQQQISQSQEYQSLLDEYPNVFQTIQDTLNVNNTIARLVYWNLWDSLRCNFFSNYYNMPEAFRNQSFYDELTILTHRGSNMQLYGWKELTQLSSTVLLQMVSDQMQEVASGNLTQKFHFYSAHDTTVQAILYALDLTNEYSWPVFASTVFFELYQDTNGQYFVQTIFNDKLQQLPGCDVQCNLDDFILIMKKFTLPNFQEACKVPETETIKRPDWRFIPTDNSPGSFFVGDIIEKLEYF